MNKTVIRKLLDKLFCFNKLSFILPLVIAAVMLVLGTALGGGIGEDVWFFIITSVVISAVWFGFVYFLIRMFTKLKNCPDWYTDTFELLALSGFTVSALLQIIDFIRDTNSFSASICICFISLSAISLAHNKRN